MRTSVSPSRKVGYRELRYGLPGFYEIHVWAFEHNPSGSFADCNNRVVCDKQPLK
jgi:hypothetical protein